MRSTLRNDLIELFSQAGSEFISGQKSVMLSDAREQLYGSILRSFAKKAMKWKLSEEKGIGLSKSLENSVKVRYGLG